MPTCDVLVRCGRINQTCQDAAHGGRVLSLIDDRPVFVVFKKISGLTFRDGCNDACMICEKHMKQLVQTRIG